MKYRYTRGKILIFPEFSYYYSSITHFLLAITFFILQSHIGISKGNNIFHASRHEVPRCYLLRLSKQKKKKNFQNLISVFCRWLYASSIQHETILKTFVGLRD